MEKETHKAQREMAAEQLHEAWETFHSAVGMLYESAKVYPDLHAYAEKVFAHMEEHVYGIGGILNVIDRLTDHDQKQPSAEDIKDVL